MFHWGTSITYHYFRCLMSSCVSKCYSSLTISSYEWMNDTTEDTRLHNKLIITPNMSPRWSHDIRLQVCVEVQIRWYHKFVDDQQQNRLLVIFSESIYHLISNKNSCICRFMIHDLYTHIRTTYCLARAWFDNWNLLWINKKLRVRHIRNIPWNDMA